MEVVEREFVGLEEVGWETKSNVKAGTLRNPISLVDSDPQDPVLLLGLIERGGGGANLHTSRIISCYIVKLRGAT